MPSAGVGGWIPKPRNDSAASLVGSQFDVVALFRGKRQRFRYTVTALDDGRRIVLRGDGEKATSVDAITVETNGSGSRITYTADIKLWAFAAWPSRC